MWQQVKLVTSTVNEGACELIVSNTNSDARGLHNNQVCDRPPRSHFTLILNAI